MKKISILTFFALVVFVIGLFLPQPDSRALHCEYDICHEDTYCVDADVPKGCDATLVAGCRTYDCEVVE